MNKWGIAEILAEWNSKHKPPMADGAQVPAALMAATAIDQVGDELWEPAAQIHPHYLHWVLRQQNGREPT